MKSAKEMREVASSVKDGNTEKLMKYISEQISIAAAQGCFSICVEFSQANVNIGKVEHELRENGYRPFVDLYNNNIVIKW